jgi:CheY-like chemotaxis protein
VLVVDDDPLNRTVMSSILRKLGYRFDLATNGREAVEAVSRDQYVAVLMDCLMPEMDGYEATAAIRRLEREERQAGRHLPIIAVTAVAIKGARERCLAAGMDDYLSKPVMLQSVDSLLERWTASADASVAWSTPHEPAPGGPEDDVIDRAALDALCVFDPDGETGLIAQMVGDFAAEIEPRLQTLGASAAEGQLEPMLQNLHFIAGCASIVGATRVERLARSLEADRALQSLGGAGETMVLVARLGEEVRRAEAALTSIVVACN